MSLARAFTKRMKRGDDSGLSRLGRGNTVKNTPAIRPQISSPIEFLSTTNVHALNAPDIRKVSDSSSNSSSAGSVVDSDFSSMFDRSFLTNGDNDSTPSTPITPPQESKGFFEATIESMPEAPKIPQRAPSHSKKAHVELSRKRSMQRLSPPPTSLNRSSSVRDTTRIEEEINMEPHPFGAELAKVNEVAEEFRGSTILLDEEEQFMASQGLCKFGVMDYLEEIAGLYGGIYENKLGIAANPWL